MGVRRGGTVAAIDVGTTKVCTLIGDLAPDGRLRVLGVGITASRGVQRGEIVNMAEVTAAVCRSVELAEASAGGVRVTAAHVGIAGAHISCLNTRGLTALANGSRPISDDDVDRAIDSARTIAIPRDREVVHVLPRHFVIDGATPVTNPIGMYGHRLDVEAHVITGAINVMQNVKRCMSGARVHVDALVLAQLASADAVLDDEERRHGVIVADIGGGTTDLVVLLHNAVYHTAVLSMGGDKITDDLVFGLRIPFPAAEEAKEIYGHALPSRVSADETVEVDAFGAEGRRTVYRRWLCEIVQARMEEILEMIGAEIDRAGLREMVPAGLVLTGGAANLEGVEELAAQVLQMPVRVAYPRELAGRTEIILNPAFATSIGLLMWAARDRGLRAADDGADRVAAGQGPTWLRKLQEAIRVILP